MNAGSLTIGTSHDISGEPTGLLGGFLDEVRISNGALAGTERLNADPPIWPATADVVGYWRFETTGTTVADVSGNGLGGTVVGTAPPTGSIVKFSPPSITRAESHSILRSPVASDPRVGRRIPATLDGRQVRRPLHHF